MASLMKFGFNLLKQKRAREEESTLIAKFQKTPKASDISIETGPKPILVPKRLPMNAPVDVCIYRVTELASDLWELLQGQDEPLFQVQIRHEQQRAVTYDIRNSFNELTPAWKSSLPEHIFEKIYS